MIKNVDGYTLLNKTVKMSLLDEFRLVESSVNYYYPKTLKWPPQKIFKLFIYFKMTTITTIYSMQTQNFKQTLSWWQIVEGISRCENGNWFLCNPWEIGYEFHYFLSHSTRVTETFWSILYRLRDNQSFFSLCYSLKPNVLQRSRKYCAVL